MSEENGRLVHLALEMLSILITSTLIALKTAATLPPWTPQDSFNAATQCLAVPVPAGLSCDPTTVDGIKCNGHIVNCAAPDKKWGGLMEINCVNPT
ncbi:hypothetical protein C8J57DRAFT_1493073 [Mycena rebaudengoi]|nr:hypothetical protein C8J57DRAFT_1493073 [Mycena rebaudengoi]